MEPPTVPDFNKPLSLRLCKILDKLGASEDIRKLSTETGIIYEIVRSCIGKQHYRSYYTFGSKVEGTTTAGLASDTDWLYCFDRFEVFQCISDIPLELDQEARLIVRDRDTKPGYCKLQMVKSRTPITRIHVRELLKTDIFQFDCNDRLVEKALPMQSDGSTKLTAHGPAMTTPVTSVKRRQDLVAAHRCRSWPNAASEWPDRIRKYGWPSQDLIQKMQTLGFFVVKVGHPLSNERDLEWRISLSLQERLLMFSLNPTQFKCYILLKMIKKDGINNKLGEEAITSYHCKTCLFYTIENTPGDLWQPGNLLACLQCCLKCIHKCVKTGNCPNYFIPEENMFEGRIDDELRIKLENICYNLLTSECCLLLAIQCDDLGKGIMNNIFPGTFTEDSDITVKQRFLRYIERIAAGVTLSASVLDTFREGTASEIIRALFKCIHNLSNHKTITEYTTEEIRAAAYIALPYLELCLLSNIIAGKVELGEVETAVDLLLSSKWQELCQRSDCFSAKLKQATFLYMLGQYEASVVVLAPLPINSASLKIPHCNCRDSIKKWPNVLIKEKKGICLDDFRRSYYVPCILFSPHEKKLVPIPLAYEMLRSVYMQPHSWDYFSNFFHPSWAMVDGEIYLYFLLFLLNECYDGTPYSGPHVMELVLERYQNLKHKETAMNLIGWCYKQKGNIGKAIEYFCKSLALMKSHNAAFWHLMFTVYEIITNKTKQKVKKFEYWTV